MAHGCTSAKGRGCPLESSRPVSILIGSPVYSGSIYVETVGSLLAAVHHLGVKCPQHKIDIRFRVRTFSTYAAERISEAAVGGYDYLLFWGDDMLPPPNTIERLLSHDKDVVACAVFARTEPFPFYAYDDNYNTFHVKRLGTGLQRCRAAGTGVMLIKTAVFKKMNKPWWEWPNDPSTDIDIEWCKRAEKEAGAEIWVDTDLVAGHLITQTAIVDGNAHKAWVKSVIQSGVMDSPAFKAHKDYKKLEAMIHGSNFC